mmetsp:Transcript_26009/g.38476  ORF Transcript_26009/g.38476 Transcript_26009/m.38476 type:complete len:97 (+) Transcript_26009:882-1172(+)
MKDKWSFAKIHGLNAQGELSKNVTKQQLRNGGMKVISSQTFQIVNNGNAIHLCTLLFQDTVYGKNRCSYYVLWRSSIRHVVVAKSPNDDGIASLVN